MESLRNTVKNLWDTIKTIFYAYAIQYVAMLLAVVIYLVLNNKNKSILNDMDNLYKLCIVVLTLVLVPLSIYLYKKYKRKEQPIKANKLFPLIPLGLSLSLFYNMLTITMQQSKTIISLNPILLVLYTVILGPIFEELVFRYISLNRAREVYKKNTAILLISFVFAILHSGLINSIYAFLLGLVLASIYLKYKNIVYPITIHMSANLMSVFVSKFNFVALVISGLCLLLTILYIEKTNHS